MGRRKLIYYLLLSAQYLGNVLLRRPLLCSLFTLPRPLPFACFRLACAPISKPAASLFYLNDVECAIHVTDRCVRTKRVLVTLGTCLSPSHIVLYNIVASKVAIRDACVNESEMKDENKNYYACMQKRSRHGSVAQGT